MKRLWRTKWMRIGLILVGWLTAAGGLAHAADRPNIVLILADDMGFSDIGCYGSEIETPNIDKLAQEGLRFRSFYNCARCCPSRASILTGVYPHQAGIGAMCQDLGDPAYRGDLSPNVYTIAEVLRGAGYHTAMVGKWHLSNLTIDGSNKKSKQMLDFQIDEPISPSTNSWPCNRGFEEHFGTIAGVDSYFDPYSLVHNENLWTPPPGFYYTDFINNKAAEFIDRFSTDGKPFFLYVAETAPHWPMQALDREISKYADRYKVGWDRIRSKRYQRQLKMGLIDPRWKLSLHTEEKRFARGASVVGAWEDAPDKDWQARRMAVYAAMVDRLDQGVGRILAKLKEKKLDENTLVIFLSDNGACAENVQDNWYDVPNQTRDGRKIEVGNDPKVMPGSEETFQSYGPAWANASNTPFRRFKHFTEEGGISAPFIARWPGVVKNVGGIETRAVGHVMDLMPTFLQAAGVSMPSDRQKLEGISLVGILRGEHAAERGPIFWEHEGNRAVRQGNWKLIAAHNEPWQLYDLENDRTELSDLSAKMPNKVNQMESLYTAWAHRAGVRDWPLKKPTTRNTK